jgi:hypothetical protein
MKYRKFAKYLLLNLPASSPPRDPSTIRKDPRLRREMVLGSSWLCSRLPLLLQ